MTELQLQIAATRRWLDAIDAAADRGEVPMLADARLLRTNAAHVETMIEFATVEQIRSQRERTPEEDRAAQRVVP